MTKSVTITFGEESEGKNVRKITDVNFMDGCMKKPLDGNSTSQSSVI